jgi:release factor glutamine methyltransferase
MCQGRLRLLVSTGKVPLPTSSSLPAEADVVVALRRAGCVFAEDEAALLVAAATTPTDLAALVERRVGGLPLEHVLGWAEFCGLRLAVDPGVFVPRRRTEFLVGQAAELAPPGAVVVDLCCGCGAIGAALASVVTGIELHAVDVDPVAVRCAARNLPTGRAHVGDLYQPLPAGIRGRVDVLVANAPYVPSDAIELMPSEARLYEPRTALDGGADGLDLHRRVAAQAIDWLAPGGQLLIETSEAQAPTAVSMFTRCGLTARVARSPDGEATVIIGTAPGGSAPSGSALAPSPAVPPRVE